MYRQAVESLEAALEPVQRGSLLGGEVQMWLVYAYEAAGKTQEAIALCEVASRHPHMDTRREAKRVLFILKAPRLKPKAEWLTQIPDLAELEEGDRPSRFAAAAKPLPPTAPPVLYRLPEDPTDPSQVNTQDNGFVWLALGAIALFIGALLWLG
ncbi:MAG: hypothetical protein KME20_18515 [Kaiparowitsia implicata GSE-PSE-MK54-09C]|jgi:hypothetical protein|nr:hypothetical protein [Kaiparowitsia implicata GSE-PSE-MK54-09C]